MIKKLAIAILFLLCMILIIGLAIKATHASCEPRGKDLGKKTVVIGNGCYAEGYGRIF
ncbi:MAG: hypothetical protein ACRCXB_31295 [Aeromonadaceae bacterium]